MFTSKAFIQLISRECLVQKLVNNEIEAKLNGTIEKRSYYLKSIFSPIIISPPGPPRPVAAVQGQQPGHPQGEHHGG